MSRGVLIMAGGTGKSDNRRVTSIPSISGMLISRSTTSKRWRFARSVTTSLRVPR